MSFLNNLYLDMWLEHTQLEHDKSLEHDDKLLVRNMQQVELRRKKMGKVNQQFSRVNHTINLCMLGRHKQLDDMRGQLFCKKFKLLSKLKTRLSVTLTICNR
jgi:hypothetical protein